MSIKRLLFQFSFLLLTAMVLNGCSTFPGFPPAGPCVFTIQASDIPNCYTKFGGTQKIKFFINIVTKFYDPNNGGRVTNFDDKSITINPSTTTFPIQITANIPNQASTPFEVEVNFVGDECSTCANGASNFSETPYGVCQPVINTTTTPWTTMAAKPRFKKDVRFSSYVATINVGTVGQILNVPNTCGCLVSWL